MDETLDYAERRTRAGLAAMPDGERTAADVLEGPEGDLELVLRATVEGDAWSSTSPARRGQHRAT